MPTTDYTEFLHNVKQEYIVLKLRPPTNSEPTISSGDQVCCNLDSITAAN